MKRRIFDVILLLLLIASAWLGYYGYRPLPLPTNPFEFTLKPGSSLKSMARDMHQAGLLEQAWPFVWMSRLMGQANNLKAGHYALQQPVTHLELLRIVTKGEVSQTQISVIEGWTFKQLRAAIDAHPKITHDTLNLSDAEIMQRIGASETHPEGLFFPDTYHVATGSSDVLMFKRAYLTMQEHLQAAWLEREPDLPLANPYQALILASIVEKETGAPSDRAIIAGVFLNRLKIGMLLQTDPTVIYGMGDKFDGNLRRRDLIADTSYNTYKHGGLPPTPIALPGLAALQATLHPAQTDALYFVARGDGSSQFSNSLTQHNNAVNQYQK